MVDITKFWYRRNWLSYSLLPFAFLYRTVVALRRWLYAAQIKKTTRFAVPVIVIGNITVGGTGKTPLIIWLANYLQQQGYRPGIVSRGYGGKAAQYPLTVTRDAAPQIVGDEALIIVRHTNCPLVIAPDRVAAVNALLHTTDCNIVLSDDGLQHYALARDIQVVVIDGERRFGNGFYLPAGPLRESPQRLQSVDFIVSNGTAHSGEYAMQLLPKMLHRVAQSNVTAPLSQFSQQTVHAVAGIGNPQRFFALLKQQGLTFVPHVFPDHHAYQAKDLVLGKDANIIMTEKDAVKCTTFATENWWYLPVQAEVDSQFAADILKKIIAVDVALIERQRNQRLL